MRKLIFGTAFMVCGLLLVLIMLFIGANPNAIGSLNPIGKLLALLGVVAFAAGLIISILNISDE